MNIREKIRAYTTEGHKTLLGVGPMSKNIVDVSIELANTYDVPLMLIASRRQVDSSYHGGGYVNNWTTKEFAGYVQEKDNARKVVLARDHGGPWQTEKEQQSCTTLAEAMASAKRSYEADIDSGFQVIHIDPSVGVDGPVSAADSLKRAFELYEHCWEYSQKVGADIAFEIGTEEQQAGGVSTLDDLETQLEKISKFCELSGIPLPLYVVVQTGTKVMELRNVGSFDSSVRVNGQIPSEILVPKIIETCQRHSIFLKQHNTDYLTDNALKAHPFLGIHAANVAPEFGVSETLGFLNLLEQLDLKKHRERFVELTLESGKWKKWMLTDTRASDLDRAKISGHYIFSSKEFLELKSDVGNKLLKKNIVIDEELKKHVRKSIMRYMRAFRLAQEVH